MANDRIQTLLEPSYAERLDARSTDDLRDMKHECGVIENSVSFYRRLAQGRIEILDGDSEQFGLRVGDQVPYAAAGPSRAHAHTMAPAAISGKTTI